MSARHIGFAVVTMLVSVACSPPMLPPAPPAPAPVTDVRPVAERPAVAPSATPAARPMKSSAVRGATIEAALERFTAVEKVRLSAGERVIERVDLNGDGGKDALVLLRSRRFCSSRGCTLLVFQQVKGGYELHSRLLLGRTPMIATNARTGGWRDLVAPMTSARAGTRLVVLRHGSGGYPADVEHLASIPPTRDITGQVLFSDD